MPAPPAEAARLLARVREGDVEARDRLVGVLYDELRALARSQRRRVGAGDTLNTTALVHEAYEKLAGRTAPYEDRRHFFGIAARAMRDVLVDYARAQSAQKRGGSGRDLSLGATGAPEPAGPPVRVEEVLGVDRALGRLAGFDPEGARVVELRYFAGLSVAEAAGVLGVSERTVIRRWVAARAWLQGELGDGLEAP